MTDKITESARGEECQIRYPGICNRNRETTIWAHSNALGAGRGIAYKSLSLCGSYACSACHDCYDGRIPRPKHWTADDVRLMFYQGHERSLVVLASKGLI